MIRKIYEDVTISYVGREEFPEPTNEDDFLIAESEVENTDRINCLLLNGFRFHERYLDYQISLNKFDSKLMSLVRADVRKDRNIDDEMYELANKSFFRDRRFHLNLRYDNVFARKIISGYLNNLSDEGCFSYKCYHKARLIGFTIIKPCGNGCKNLLGAVDPDYQKKGAAFNLYVFMADSLKRSGYEFLEGSISSSNIASLNLHLMLGAAFTGAWEQYIKVQGGYQ